MAIPEDYIDMIRDVRILRSVGDLETAEKVSKEFVDPEPVLPVGSYSGRVFRPRNITLTEPIPKVIEANVLSGNPLAGIMQFLDQIEPFSEMFYDLFVTEGQGDIGIIPEGTLGIGGQGWRKKKIDKYVFGRKEIREVWYKPYKSMSEIEKRAYYQGQRARGVSATRAKNEAYKRGYDDGAYDQQQREMMSEGGITPTATYRRSRRRR
jgi:hypothetical protein